MSRSRESSRASQSFNHSVEPADTLLRRVIDHDEELLWAGRPDVGAFLKAYDQPQRTSPLRLLMPMAALAVFAWIWVKNSGGTLPSSFDEIVPLLQGKAVFPIIAVVLIFVATRILNRRSNSTSRVENWLRAQSYGITDRRLLVLADDKIEEQLGPEEFGATRLKDRAPGVADVVLKVNPIPSEQRTSRLQREKHCIAFRALTGAEGVQRRIEDWRRQFRLQEEERAQAFLEEAEKAASRSGKGDGVQTLKNQKYGLTLCIPESWTLQVRSRRKPYGKTFLEFERWKTLDALPDWNVLNAKGDFLTSFELHVDQTRKPTMIYQQMKNSTLINAMSGKVVESDDNLRFNGFSGFSITREHMERNPKQGGRDRGRPALQRLIAVHDGRIQLAMLMLWPEGSESIRRALDRIVESITVHLP